MISNARTLALQSAVSACDDADRAREVHQDLGSRAFRSSLPSELAGVFPRYRPTACARLVGTLHAAALREQLVQTHDEDWFDNPRAQQQLREIDVTDRRRFSEDTLVEAARTLARQAAQQCA
jgi:hypothetical protein